jgi:uncharacterized membrane protein YcaP (DUF421 family)
MRETITVSELELAARKQGFQSLDEIQTAQLEVGGALTFVPKRPTGEEARHRELLTRLESLAAAQDRLALRIDALRPDAAN